MKSPPTGGLFLFPTSGSSARRRTQANQRPPTTHNSQLISELSNDERQTSHDESPQTSRRLSSDPSGRPRRRTEKCCRSCKHRYPNERKVLKNCNLEKQYSFPRFASILVQFCRSQSDASNRPIPSRHQISSDKCCRVCKHRQSPETKHLKNCDLEKANSFLPLAPVLVHF